MVSIFKKSLLALGFVFASFACVSAFNVGECRKELASIARELVDKSIYNYKIHTALTKSSSLTEEELIELCDNVLLYQKELGAAVINVENIKNKLINYLKSFVASGMDIQVDPNFALFYDEMNPNFDVTFTNPAGEIKTRKYALKIWSIGLKFEMAIKVVGISIVGENFNYYDTNKKFNLGSGIDLGINPSLLLLMPIPVGCSFVYAGIAGTNCGILMLGFDFGYVDSISIVFGGSMTPINE